MMKVAQVATGKQGLKSGSVRMPLASHMRIIMVEGLLSSDECLEVGKHLSLGIGMINVTVLDEVLALVFCSSRGDTATGLADALGSDDCD